MKAKFRPQRRAGRPAHGCYPGATGSKTIPNCEDCCNCCGEGRSQPSNPKPDYETKPIRPFFSTKARNGSQIPSALDCGTPPRRDTNATSCNTPQAKSLQPSRRD